MKIINKRLNLKINQKRKTVLWRIIVPLIAVMLIQPVLYAAAFGVSGIFSGIEDNALSLFNEISASRSIYLRDEMINKWSNFDDEYPMINRTVRRVLADENATISDIKTNVALNDKICQAITPEILDILRQNGTNGAYFILNGSGAADIEGEYAGVFLRDNTPTNFSVNNGDVTLVRGTPSTFADVHISLDVDWQRSFGLDDQREKNAESSSDFFFKPISFAAVSSNRNASYFGYWSGNFQLDPNNPECNLSYSLPLIYDDGTVYGVLGVEISQAYLSGFLPYDELTDNGKGVYVLAKTQDWDKSYNKVCVNGPASEKYFEDNQIITVAEHDEPGFVVLEGETMGALLGCSHALELYRGKTIFSNEGWVLLAVAPKSTMLSELYRMEGIFAVVTIIFLAIGLLTAFLTAIGITRPIGRLVNELKNSDPHKPIKLRRIQMAEIDELSESIESLSQSVEASASRISKIITMSGLPLGVYEFQKAKGEVFCSKSLFDVLGWNGWDDERPYLEMKEFRRRFKDVLKNIHSAEQGVYQVTGNDGVSRWVKIKSLQEGERTLGAILDVTREVEEKMKIEYERDYDVLTSLYNRFAFTKAVDVIAETGAEKIKCAAMIMLDLDNLKYVNDRYGHDCGDKYIQAMASCLMNFRHYKAIVGRRSGDEFYVFIYGYESQDEIRYIVDVVWGIINQEYILLPNGEEYRIRASAGIAWYGNETHMMRELIKYADYAMYRIKHTSKGNIGEFDYASYKRNAILLTGSEALNRLIDGKLLKYALQPIVSAGDGSIFGYEMLMRPQIEELSSPTEVLKLAAAQSKLRIIEEITVIGGLRAFKHHVVEGHIGTSEKVFINTIGNQMLSNDSIQNMEEEFDSILKRIVLELTEEERTNGHSLNKKSSIVKKWGAMMAIDDYGTGYNREAILMEFAPDVVKIDISFIHGVDRDENRKKLIQSMMMYAREQEIKVLAEGVETKGEMETMIMLGVDYLQGYYIGRPNFEPLGPSDEVVSQIRDAHKARELEMSEYMKWER